MQLPLQISFRNMNSSAAVEARIQEEAAKLEMFYDRIMSCRITVELSRYHSQRSKVFHIRLDLTVPGGEIIVRHEPGLPNTAKHSTVERPGKTRTNNEAHKDILLAIHDAFKTARRQLQDFARKQHGEVKQHLAPPEGKVLRLDPAGTFGFLQTPDGEEIYFHRNSVLHNAFAQLAPGSIVTFVAESGEKGPQARAVKLTGQTQHTGPE
ncbi:MAG TPA: HPF/RaiA family ribosome-associated protein [Blastocatellia bacterium]|nr:HPF/RaiA family ribosome-associated protein [Blastocatellia bacterium]